MRVVRARPRGEHGLREYSCELRSVACVKYNQVAESPPCKATPVSSHAPGLSLFTVTGLIVILLWQLSLYCTVLATKRKGYGCMYHPLSQSELHTCLPGLLRTPVASEKCESSPTTVPPRLPCLSTTHVSCIKSCRAAAAKRCGATAQAACPARGGRSDVVEER